MVKEYLRSLTNLRLVLLVIAIALGALDSWSTRYSINQMGISYLDMGDAIMRGEWHASLNGLWSPLYGLLLGLVMSLVKPSAKWEFSLIHLINFLIYLVAIVAFERFLRELIKWQQERQASVSSENRTTLPEWGLVTIGYALFIWCTVGLINMATTAPDLLLVVFVYFAFALLLRKHRHQGNWRSLFVLGLVLGFGFLTKAPMFPLAPLFILVASFPGHRNLRKSGVHFAAAALGLLLVAGPLIIAFSASKQRLSFGDSSRLNYLWHVNKVPAFHWQGDDLYGNGSHTTRKIFEHPAIYEFGTPLTATYPPWYDPSYWYEGAQPRFDLQQQITALRSTAKAYLEILSYRSHLVVMGAFLTLLYISRKNWVRDFFSVWILLIPSLAAFVIYLPVHVEPRYLAPFIAPFWLLLFSTLRPPAGERYRRLVRYVIVVMAVLMISAQTIRTAAAFRAAIEGSPIHKAENESFDIIAALNRRGIQSGDAIGIINFQQFWLPSVHWARLGRFRVVAELPTTESDKFLTADEGRRHEIIDAFSKTGAKALIAIKVPRYVTLRDWERVGDTSYYLLKLDLPVK